MPETIVKARYPLPVDADTVRADWQAQGYSFHGMTDRPGQQWNDFVHSTSEYLTVAEGRLRVFVGEEEVIAEPGDLLYIDAGVPHSVHNINGAPTRWYFGYD